RARISVVHAPALTAKIAAGARALGAGRSALASLSLRDLIRVRRRYAQEAGSRALRWNDLAALLRGRSREDAPETPAGDGVPLFFPSRVTIELDSGAVCERIDLPPGSLASPGFDDELARKVLRVLPHEALAAGLALETREVSDLVGAFSAPLRARSTG
ncbi:MAG: hypothetical protein IT386_04490, partial [Deltaproteobacteria bacterium]|nr:hypothetical protein [Deltaproteobacteria bacterium]